MNGDRIKLLYEKIKNTTNKIDKQNLLVELGDVIVTYGSDKATKLDFIVMYCASVERADPHVVDFILKYDYKKTPSYFNKTWGFFSKFTKVASQAQNAFSSFETLTSGNELDEILKKIEEEKKKEKPDNDYLEVLDNQKDQILLNTGNNFFEFMGNLGSAVLGIGLLVEEYFDAGKGILSYGYKVVKEHKEKLQTILNELEDSNKKESGKENLINEIRSESNFILTVVKNIQAFKDSELISIIKDRDRENHIKGLFNTYEQEIIDLEKTIKSISAKIKELANYELSGNNVLSLSSSFIESSHRYVKQNLDISVQNYDPLIVDLGNDGFNMKSLENGVYFDLDRNNTKEKTTWVDKNDALLAIDLDANGRIDNGQELFGDYFKMPDDSYATSSIQALSSLDSNKDGVIDKGDEAYSKILVWKDENQNGISEENELSNLVSHNIKSIEIGNIESKDEIINGSTLKNIIHFNYGGENKTGKGKIGEFLLNKDNVDVKDEDLISQIENPNEEERALIQEIMALPDIRAYGRVRTLRNALYQDKSQALLDMVKRFLSAKTVEEKDAILDDILFKIGGAEDLDSTSQGEHIDAKKVKVLESFFDQSLVQGTIEPQRAQFYKDAYDGIKLMYYSLLNIQAKFNDMESLLAIKENELININYLNSYISMEMLQNPSESENTFKEYSRLLMYFEQLGVKGFQTFKDYFMQTYPDYSKLIAESNTKVYLGTELSDQITIYSPNATIKAGEGDDSVNGTFNGRSGNEFFIGGKGNDVLQGGLGSDTYYYELGDGLDTISDSSESGDINTLVFGQGITKNNIDIQHIDGSSIKIRVGENGEGVILENQVSQNPSVHTIYFGNGETLSHSEMLKGEFRIQGDEADCIC